jgi:hypothetical protein
MNYELNKLVLSIENNYLKLTIDENIQKGNIGPASRQLISFYPTRSTSFRLNYILGIDSKGNQNWLVSTIELMNTDSGNRYFINESDLLNGKIQDSKAVIFNIASLELFLTQFTNI